MATLSSTTKDLAKLGIKSEKDLLLYFPYRHEDFSKMKKIADIKVGEQVSIRGVVKSITAVPGFRGRINRAEGIISDESGSIKVVWFNQFYIAKYLKKGDEIFISGKPTVYKTLQFQNPLYEKLSSDGEQIHTGRILPVYSLTGGLTLRTLRQAIFNALPAVKNIEETLPTEVVKDLGFLSIQETVRNLHFPEDPEVLAKARRRIAFEEIFNVQLGVQQNILKLKKQKAFPLTFDKNLIKSFIESLPFELTADQKTSLWEILQDVEKPHPMNRLLEGDVGSGKTLVALAACLQCAADKKQAILLCPTEILAQQHYRTALKYLEQFPNISVILLTSKFAQINGADAAKKHVIEEIDHGGAQIIISTHAILEKSVSLDKVGLIIIDEQHRFGVKQRENLKRKQKRIVPHQLMMTATPIPRTLQGAIFGDLEVSRIKTKPAGRLPIKTLFVEAANRGDSYKFISAQIKDGRQIFVVTPLIDESDKLGVKAATTEQKNLQKVFPQYNVGLLHGRMKSTEKEKVMQDFLDNKIHILVSTAVIEVGIDVPNASVMVIEGSERFGLAQLHQFRGRVGRADHKSFCFLFSDSANPETIERLKKFSLTSDGFELAEIDLYNRGFGDLFGEAQSGFGAFKFFNFKDYEDLIKPAQEWAKRYASL